jgi:hypothetical protein
MLKNVEDWIFKARRMGLLDWDGLREATQKDVANQNERTLDILRTRCRAMLMDGGVCSVCFHQTHPGRRCSALVFNEEHPLDSDRFCGCES